MVVVDVDIFCGGEWALISNVLYVPLILLIILPEFYYVLFLLIYFSHII